MVTAQLHQLSVVVASRNAVKINAVAAALQRALPGVTQLAVSGEWHAADARAEQIFERLTSKPSPALQAQTRTLGLPISRLAMQRRCEGLATGCSAFSRSNRAAC
jgi:hypothetical protein